MQSERILLRRWLDSDARSLFKYASDPDVGPRAGWPPHKSVEESLTVIREIFSNDTTWAIVLKETGEAIGAMGYFTHATSNIPVGENDCEVGYWVAKPYWNQGICTEALRLMLDYCINEKHFENIWSDHFMGNPASGRVMEKCGFMDTGKLNRCSNLLGGDKDMVRIYKLDTKTQATDVELTDNGIRFTPMKIKKEKLNMIEILHFLRDLSCNNNKEWFTANKERYQEVLQKWYDFCEELIKAIGQYDPDIAQLTIKDCTYRIYRDTRFSNDKSPYKTHFGVFLSKGGKKSMHAGYYFHIGTGDGDEYPHYHMLAAGNYCYDPQAIKILREDISDGWDEFKADVLDKADPSFVVDMDGALKRVPKEYPADAPYADFMRLKSYSLLTKVDDEFILQPNLVQRVSELFLTAKPFNDYINRAVDYAKEE